MNYNRVPLKAYVFKNEYRQWCVVLEGPREVMRELYPYPTRPLLVANYGGTCGAPTSSMMIQPRIPTWRTLWYYAKLKLRSWH